MKNEILLSKFCFYSSLSFFFLFNKILIPLTLTHSITEDLFHKKKQKIGILMIIEKIV